jgi:hypothetical protein
MRDGMNRIRVMRAPCRSGAKYIGHRRRRAAGALLLALMLGPASVVGAAASSHHSPAPPALWHTGVVIKLSSNHASMPLAWRPDSQAVLIRNMGSPIKPGGSLWLVGVHGHSRRLLVETDVQDAVFLPSGRFVLYREANADWRHLHLRLIDDQGHLIRVFHLGRAEVVQNTTGGYGFFVPSLAEALLANGRIVLYLNRHLIELDPLTGRRRSINRRPFSIPLNDNMAVPYAALSPDERHIATFSITGGLEVRSAITGRPEWQIASPRGMDMLAWTPDSKTLAFEGGGPAGEIAEVNIVTRKRRLAVHLDLHVVTSFAWSPDGRVLAFSAMGVGNETAQHARITFFDERSRLTYIMDGQHASAVPGEIGPMWAPNGRMLAYTRVFNRVYRGNPAAGADIYVVRLIADK